MTEQEVLELMKRADLRFDSEGELNRVTELIESSGFTKRQIAVIAIIAISASTKHVNDLANLAFDTFEQKANI